MKGLEGDVSGWVLFFSVLSYLVGLPCCMPMAGYCT